MYRDTYDANKYGRIVFAVPAFGPLVLYLVFLFDFDASGIDHLFYENIEIFNRAFETKRSNEVLVWGYLFSMLYLILILPYMAKQSKRTVFLGRENRNRTKATWFMLAIFFFSLFLFMNFVDFSSGSRKYVGMVELSFYFWPLFYFWFLFPLYVSLMFAFGFVNIRIA